MSITIIAGAGFEPRSLQVFQPPYRIEAHEPDELNLIAPPCYEDHRARPKSEVCKDYERLGCNFKQTQPEIEGHRACWALTESTTDINSLDELMSFVKKVGKIKGEDAPYPIILWSSPPHIDIYNEYRE